MFDHGRALPVKAIASSSVTLDRVLDVEVLRTLTTEAGTQLSEVALVLRLTTNRPDGSKLKVNRHK